MTLLLIIESNAKNSIYVEWLGSDGSFNCINSEYFVNRNSVVRVGFCGRRDVTDTRLTIFEGGDITSSFDIGKTANVGALLIGQADN